jgi:hypothetical protein
VDERATSSESTIHHERAVEDESTIETERAKITESTNRHERAYNDRWIGGGIAPEFSLESEDDCEKEEA